MVKEWVESFSNVYLLNVVRQRYRTTRPGGGGLGGWWCWWYKECKQVDIPVLGIPASLVIDTGKVINLYQDEMSYEK